MDFDASKAPSSALPVSSVSDSSGQRHTVKDNFSPP